MLSQISSTSSSNIDDKSTSKCEDAPLMKQLMIDSLIIIQHLRKLPAADNVNHHNMYEMNILKLPFHYQRWIEVENKHTFNYTIITSLLMLSMVITSSKADFACESMCLYVSWRPLQQTNLSLYRE